MSFAPQPSFQDIINSGTLTYLNSSVYLTLNNSSGAIVNVAGTWVGTILFEGSNDGFITSQNAAVFTPPAGVITAGVTTNAYYRFVAVSGFTQIRARMSVYTSGTAIVVLSASIGSGLAPTVSINYDSMLGTSKIAGGTDATKIGNVSDSLKTYITQTGQQTSSASIPVVLASDQPTLSVTLAPVGTGPVFNFGDVTTTGGTNIALRRTTYLEQSSDAQRSIVSSNINDALAGTGARKITIIYYNSIGNGPYSETITLNGTTPVNTINTNICFIEKIIVSSVGSTNSNIGIISLKAAITGGGVTIGTVAATNNQTFWAHHYIGSGKICYISGISCSHDGTSSGTGGLFILKSLSIGISNAVELQISDFVRLFGQSSTFARVYQSQIKVIGPARITAYVTPETNASTTYRCAFDLTE
ncbi:membrane hypothetical protein [Azospirillaceae bacterium]